MRTQVKKARRSTSSGHAPKERLEQLLREASVLRGLGAVGRAEETYRQAVRVCPQADQARAELGCFLIDCERYSEARDCFRRALAIIRPAALARDAATEAEDVPREAVRLLEKIVAVHPSWTRGVFSLGSAYKAIGDHGPAREHLTNALALDRELEAAVRSQFASMKWRENEPEEAIAEAERALLLDPASRQAHGVRAVCCNLLGRMDEAVASFRRAIEIEPDPTLHRSMLFAMNFLPETTPEAHYEEARRWDSLYAAPLACHIRPHDNVPDPERRLKIAYVSPDLYNHAIMRFIPPIFENHDHTPFEIWVYSVGVTRDDLTEGVRGRADHWVDFQGSGKELAERVRADGIDILVDLAGHTMDWGVYQVFAMKPAPVQVSWMGVNSTTGLSAMDYFLGDELLPCPGTEHLFSETVYRMPGACYCYRPFADVPVAPAPCLQRGYITFGAYHNPAKITRDVAHLWAAVLDAVPGSRLLIKYRFLELEARQERLVGWFAENGVHRDRLQFAGASLQLEYLAAYGDIDVALDPFPYNGGSTTLDTMWMGVPVVTMAGRLAVQRAGADVLTLVGSPDLVAETPEQYVRAAVFLSKVVPKIPELRHNVRRAFQASCIMDEARVVRNLEAAYRDMWRTWCRTRGAVPGQGTVGPS